MNSANSKASEELRNLISRTELELAELEVDSFNRKDALRLGMILVRRATEEALPVAMNITRGTQTLFHVALEGTTADNDDWIARKTRAVERFGVPSLLLGLRSQLTGVSIEDEPWFDVTLYAAHGGCFPIVVKGTGQIATVTVSGLPQLADHELVVAALREFIAKQ